jgi:hypothetical protein
MITLLFVVAALAEPIGSGVTVLTGIGTTFDDDPATMNLEFQGEFALVPGKKLGLGLIAPLQLTTGGRQTFGMSFSNAMLTFTPSARIRTLNDGPVRPYVDGGVGIAHITADDDRFLFRADTARTGWTTRFVLGLEAGSPDGGIAFVFEPVVLDTLQFKDLGSIGYTARIGVGARH